MNNLLDRGTFVLSIDVELDEGSPRYHVCREVVNDLLKLMERYEIHATWAVMGYMFLDKCYFDSPSAKREIIRGWRVGLINKPLDDDFYSQLTKGKEILQQILSSKISQEIGCHTFSHIRAGDPNCSRECFESELEACKSASEAMGVMLRSFVFPYNSVGYLDSLHKYSYTAYRGPSDDWFTGLPTNLIRLAHLFDHLLVIPSPEAVVTRDSGVWDLPASYFYACGAGWGKLIPISLRVNKVKKGLRLAARKRGLFHLWFHPFNLASNPQSWLNGLESIFREFCRYRDAGLLENYTMGELSSALELKNKQEAIVS